MFRPIARASQSLALLAASIAPLIGAEGTPAAAKPFTLDEAIGVALQNNFNLRTQVLTVDNAKESLAIQEAASDPTLTASTTRAVSQAASTTSRLDGTASQGPRSDNTTMRVGATLPKISATNGSVSLTANVTRAATNSTNALFNPSFGNGVSANLTQPLMRDAGRRAANAAIDRARLGLTIASIGYKSSVLQLISDTENAYYNLVAARESYRIRQLSLERYQLLLDESQARRKSGVATDLDVLTAEVNVANARRALIQQEQTVRDTEERLLNTINLPAFDTQLGPVSFNDYTDGAPNFAQSYKQARDYYPDTLSAAETLKQLEIDLETAKRNTLPTLDLTASLGYTARATNQGYQQAISNLPNDHGNNWAMGLNYSMPWGRNADKARFRQASNNISSQKIRIEQLEQALMMNVRQAVRAVETNLAAVEIAAKATELAARQFDQQKARYDAGLSTSRIVVQFQEDLETARFNELSAKVALRRAVAELRRLEGSSIGRYKVELLK